jgi:hypothetical protein
VQPRLNFTTPVADGLPSHYLTSTHNRPRAPTFDEFDEIDSLSDISSIHGGPTTSSTIASASRPAANANASIMVLRHKTFFSDPDASAK